ncbi:hypothetical protein Lal_00001995 [Lupinus albus]|nr:hypothetical protein Lal_00001995 [Lupinus albus]
MCLNMFGMVKKSHFALNATFERVLQFIRNTAFGPILEIDVAYQLGLPIVGKAITGDTSMDWGDLCLQLLGVARTDKQINGQMVQHAWLESIYQQLPEDADEEVVEQHARSRVYLMYLPLPDDLSETFDYSWGSAVLACLYRGLCRAAVFKDQKEVGGCLLLLQSWAYDHIPILAPMLHDNTIRYFPLVKRWSQHLINTNIPRHTVNLIRGMLDRLRIDQYMQWYLQITRRYISPDGAYSVGAELVRTLSDLNPTAFSISRPRAPPPQYFDMSVYDSRLQHQSSSQTQFQPQPQLSSPHLYGEQPYGAFTTFLTNYHMGQSSQFQGSLPSMFATTSNTPMSAYGTQYFYCPTMPSQGNIFGNEDNEGGDGDEEEEEQELQTRSIERDVEIPQQQLRVLPPRRRRPPPCGTSSHHKRQ